MANGGDLASFHNADEQAFVTNWVSVIAFSMKTSFSKFCCDNGAGSDTHFNKFKE